MELGAATQRALNEMAVQLGLQPPIQFAEVEAERVSPHASIHVTNQTQSDFDGLSLSGECQPVTVAFPSSIMQEPVGGLLHVPLQPRRPSPISTADLAGDVDHVAPREPPSSKTPTSCGNMRQQIQEHRRQQALELTQSLQNHKQNSLRTSSAASHVQTQKQNSLRTSSAASHASRGDRRKQDCDGLARALSSSCKNETMGAVGGARQQVRKQPSFPPAEQNSSSAKNAAGGLSDVDSESQYGESHRQPDKPESASLSQLFRFATAVDWFCMFISALAAGFVGAAQPAIIVLLADVFNLAGAVQEPGTSLEESFNEIAVKSAMLGACCLVAAWIGTAGFTTSGLRQSAMWRKQDMQALLSQNTGWHDANNPSELASRVAQSAQHIEDGIGSQLALLCRHAAQGLVGVGVAFWYCWDVALVVLGLSPLVMFSSCFMNKSHTEAASDTAKAYAAADAIATETLSELRTVAAITTEQQQVDRYRANLERARRADVRKSFRIGFANGLLFGSGNFQSGAGFIYAAFKLARMLEETTKLVTVDGVEYESNCADQDAVAAGVMETCGINGGDVLIAIMALLMGSQAWGLMQPSLTALHRARASAYRIDNQKAMDGDVVIDPLSDKGQKPGSVLGHLGFHDVHFAYPTRPNHKVADGLALTVEAGSKVALVGARGSGKSTAVQLLERFYDPDQGVVTLDGVDLKLLNVRWLREQIGLVGQTPVLFQGSIADNIALGKRGATHEEVMGAALMANAHEFIMQLAEGYDTKVGDKRGLLSQGQKQLVAIARAMIKDPPVLLLDEATTGLNDEDGRMVQSALDEVLRKRKRTTLVIAHQLSTIRNVNKVAVVEEGRVVEEGTHDELMVRGEASALFRLYRQQPENAQRLCEPHGAGSEPVTAYGHGVGQAPPRGHLHHLTGGRNASIEIEAEGDSSRHGRADRQQAQHELKEVVSRVWALHSGGRFHMLVGTFGALLVGAAIAGLGVLFVKSMGSFYGSEADTIRREGLFWATGMIGIGALQIIGDAARGWGFGVPGAQRTMKLRALYFSALLRQDIAWHDLPGHDPSALSAKLADEISTVQALSGETIGRNVLSLSTIFFALALAFLRGYWGLALIAMATLPVMAGGTVLELAVAIRSRGRSSSIGQKAAKIEGELISSTRTISSFTLEMEMLNKFHTAVDSLLRSALASGVCKAVFPAYAQCSIFGAFALVYWWGGKELARGNADFESMFIPIFCIFNIGVGLDQARQSASDTGRAAKAGKHAFRIIDRQTTIDSLSEEGSTPCSGGGRIDFHDVHFAYPTRPNHKVADGLALTVEAGSKVALVGARGSGKSTAVQLLERFYDPDQGVVTLDGVDLKLLNVRWLREQIGLVGQTPVLFQGSIADNIALGKRGATHEEVMGAALMANAHEFIMQLAEGYDTKVGDKRGLLSQGQKQLVAIARAMIKDPPVLLLDEATTGLNDEDGRIVQSALDEVLRKRKRTTLVIAHQLSTIRNVNKVAVVEEGRVVEEGTHDELIAFGASGKYFSWVCASSGLC